MYQQNSLAGPMQQMLQQRMAQQSRMGPSGTTNPMLAQMQNMMRMRQQMGGQGAGMGGPGMGGGMGGGQPPVAPGGTGGVPPSPMGGGMGGGMPNMMQIMQQLQQQGAPATPNPMAAQGGAQPNPFMQMLQQGGAGGAQPNPFMQLMGKMRGVDPASLQYNPQIQAMFQGGVPPWMQFMNKGG